MIEAVWIIVLDYLFWTIHFSLWWFDGRWQTLTFLLLDLEMIIYIKTYLGISSTFNVQLLCEFGAYYIWLYDKMLLEINKIYYKFEDKWSIFYQVMFYFGFYLFHCTEWQTLLHFFYCNLNLSSITARRNFCGS